MKLPSTSCVCLASTLLFSVIPAWAEDMLDDSNINYLFDLPLEALSKIVISVASSRDQTIVEAPLIVSRYNRSDLEKMGVSSLREMLAFVPGILIQNIQAGSGAITSRGLVEAFNQKVLFLLNEVPYWAPSHSAVPLDGIPFQSIDHIEVVRGPAAVYYGTNASAAVINIVTLKDSSSRVDVSANKDLVNAGARVQAAGSHWWAHLSAEKQVDEGHDAHIEKQIPSFGLPDTGDFNQSIDKQSVLLRAGYKNLTFMAHAFDTRHNEDNGPVAFALNDGLNYKGQLYHLSYDQPLSRSSIKAFADYNQFTLRFPIQHAMVVFGQTGDGGFRFKDEENNHRWRVGLKGDRQITAQLSVLLGYDYEHRSTSEYQIFNEATNATVAPIMMAKTNNEQSLYTQVDYHYKNVRLTLGGRYIDNKNSGEHFSPELSWLYRLNAESSVKLLYAEGFNSPNFIQQGINLGPSLQGNPDLSVEKISTLDLAYTFGNEQRLFVANLFYIDAKKLIQRDVSTGVVKFDNSGSSQRSGIELDYQMFMDQWTWLSNLSYLQQGNDKDEDLSSPVAAQILATVGASYRYKQHHTLGSSIKYVSERSDANAYSLLNLAYQYQWGDVSFNTTIKNLLNQELDSADAQNLTQTMVVSDTSGTQFNLGISLDF